MLIELFIAARINSAAKSLKNIEMMMDTDDKTSEMVDEWFWKLVDRAERRRAAKLNR